MCWHHPRLRSMDVNEALQLGSAFVSGAAAGVGGVMKWFSSQLKTLRGEMDRRHTQNADRIDELETNVWTTQRDVDVLKNQQAHVVERLVSIDKKQDRQTEILLELAKRRS